MKKIILVFTVLLLGFFSITSCSNQFIEEVSTRSHSSVMFFFTLPTARTIAPSSSDLAISKYAIRLSQRGYSDLTATAATATTTAGGDGFLMNNVAPGEWNATVSALNGNDDPIASGSAPVTVVAGSMATAEIKLAYSQSIGTGGLVIELHYPESFFNNFSSTLTSIDATLTYDSTNTVALSAAIAPSSFLGYEKMVVNGTGIKTGSPLLQITYKDASGTVMGRMIETVWIFQNVVTRMNKPLVTEVLYAAPYDSRTVAWSVTALATGYRIFARDSEDNEYTISTLPKEGANLSDYWDSDYELYYFDIYDDALAVLPDEDEWYDIYISAIIDDVEGPSSKLNEAAHRVYYVSGPDIIEDFYFPGS